MGKNDNLVVVFRIRQPFRCMVLMGVTNNHTKCGPKPEWWRRETVIAMGPPFEKIAV